MTSRLGSENRMPSVPMEMPSDTVMVLKMSGAPPACCTPLLAMRASSSMCMLHGVTSLHVLAMPTIGFLKSSSVKPTSAQHGPVGRTRRPLADIDAASAQIFSCGRL